VYGFTYDNYLIPISWANVTASNGQWAFRAATSTNGGFEMFLPPGAYNLTASEPGYVSYSMVVSVSDGSSSSVNFYLYESHVPIPEFQPALLSVVIVLSLVTVTLAKKRVRPVT
jgi:hypothetical protein